MGYSLGARDGNERFIIAVFRAIGGLAIQHPPGTGFDLTAVWRSVYLVEVKRSARARQTEVTPLEAKVAAAVAAAGGEVHFIVTPLELLTLVEFNWRTASLNTLLALDEAVTQFAAESPPGWRKLALRVRGALEAAAM
jgi:hypothetical protein